MSAERSVPDRGREGADALGAARRGDRQALEDLLTSHYDRVHALCRRMLSNDADALDATQDALLAAVKGLERFDGRSSFGTWMYRIATNVCLDELRRRRRRPLVGLPDDDGRDAAGGPGVRTSARRDLWVDTATAEEVARDHAPGRAAGSAAVAPSAFGSAGLDPADSVVAKIDVDAALAQIPSEFRVAVVLRDVCDLPYDEIADVLDLPIGTVRSRIARGRAALAAILTAGRAAPAAPAAPASSSPSDGAGGAGGAAPASARRNREGGTVVQPVEGDSRP